uniref:GIR1-like zinc ribbon domain-containing protein n=1 Tax=Oryza rufipogon TaxID=4529 RepID=A0A0E0P8Z0_ORYRU
MNTLTPSNSTRSELLPFHRLQSPSSARLTGPTQQQVGYLSIGMSRSNKKSSRGIDLKLNLSLPARGDSSSRRAMAADEESSPSSCLSSENEHGLQWSNSPEATSMVLAACPRCFIYVMLPQDDPRCPQCKSPVILDFLQQDNGNNNANSNSSRKTRRG